ncbi:MAG: sugar phosphate isomerase/epimerase [Clostridia bacterium]|nr:sugar phosphate isomerase/epimerase [Clostridia bacterium]
MKSCISTYSYHRLYNDEFTRFDAIDKTKELGCDGVEFVLDDSTTPEGYTPLDYTLALTERAHKVGLEVPIYTTGANFFVKDVEKEIERVCKHIDIASACGIPLLRHDIAYSYATNEDYKGVKTYQNVIEYVAPAISKVADYAKSKGVMTCSENHGRLMQDSNRMVELFTAVNNTNYGFLCDVGNFGGVDEDCYTSASKLLDLIVHVHAKDAFTRSGMSFNPGRGFILSRGGNYRRATIFGHGNVPTYQILNAIRNSGYEGYVSLEFEGMEPAMDAITIGTENLQRMIRTIEGK